MKRKIFALILTLALTFSMSGCIWVIGNYQKLELSHSKDEVIKVEFFNSLDLGDGMAINFYEDDDYDVYTVYEIDEALEPLCVLEGDDAKSFYDRLSNLIYSDSDEFILLPAAIDPIFSECFYGYFIRITYEGGDFDLTSDSSQFFSARSEDEQFSNLDFTADWEAFISEYVD